MQNDASNHFMAALMVQKRALCWRVTRDKRPTEAAVEKGAVQHKSGSKNMTEGLHLCPRRVELYLIDGFARFLQ